MAKLATLPNAGVPFKEVVQPIPIEAVNMPSPDVLNMPSSDVLNVPSSYAVNAPSSDTEKLSNKASNVKIRTRDWFNAICQSLGEVPAVYSNETSDNHNTQQVATVPVITISSTLEDSPTNEVPASHTVDDVTSRKLGKTLQTWLIDDCLLVSLIQTDYKLHVHMRKCSVVDMNCQLSKCGIMMNMPTYIDFKVKIHHVNTKYTCSSVICNNQLAIFSRMGELFLQQIFCFPEFKLKLNALKINGFTLNKIREIIFDIDKAIEEALVNNVLPEKILEKSVVGSSAHPDLMKEFLCVIQDEVAANVHKLFQCAACEIEDPSQFNHACMTQTYDFKYMCYSTNAFLMLNVKNVVNKLQSKNILKCFNSDFFKHLTYNSIEPNLMKVSDY